MVMVFMNFMNYFKKLPFFLFVALIFSSCVKTNEQKKDFIAKKQTKTNKEIAEKYGELVIPDFVKNATYNLE